MNQSNALRRTAITFGLALAFALLSLYIQNGNEVFEDNNQIEASVSNNRSVLFMK